MSNIIVLCPTVEQAEMEFKNFCNKFGKDAIRIHPIGRRIQMLNGRMIYFKGETEGQRATLGYHADIMWLDEFMSEVLGDESRIKRALLQYN